MSQTIDQKVVEMKFDNKDFESNVKESMSTLEKLKKDLNMEGSAESFKKIGDAAKEVSFDGMSKGIEDVKAHFSGLEVVAMTALSNITNKAVDAGLQMAKSMTIGQVAAGFQQYANKTEAVQTIMAATGKSIDEVNTSLEELIWFADETSYSFSDMVNNVGKFTSVGVDLDTATKAMMGISDWAAVSGQNPQTASRAMYNLSQAMGLGYVGLMDWKSIELANMATSEFKQNVIDTAVAMGKIQEGDVTSQNFRESLKDKWFDNDVLLAVLGKYSDYMDLVYQRVQETGESCAEAMQWVSKNMGDSYDLVGEKAGKAAQEAKTFQEALDATTDAVKTIWANIFENVFGNYEEAKVTFTNLANTLWEVFAGPLSDFEETLSEAMGPKTIGMAEFRGMFNDMRNELGMTGSEWTQFEEVLKQVARDSGIDIDDIIKNSNGSFEASLEKGWLTTDLFKEAVTLVKEGGDSAASSIGKFEQVQDLVQKIWQGEYGVGEERRKQLEDLGYSYEEIQALVDKGEEYELTWEDIESVTKGYFETAGDGLDSLREKMNAADSLESFRELAEYMSGAELRNGIWDNLINSDTGAVVTYVGAIRDAFHDIFGTLESGTIHDILADIYAWTSKLLDEDRINSFKTTVENIFHGIHAAIEILKGAFSVVKAVYDNTLGPLLSGLWEIVKAVASAIGELFKKADEGASSLTIFADAVEWINTTLEPVKRVIESVTSGIASFIRMLSSGKGIVDSFKIGLDNALNVFFGYSREGQSKKMALYNTISGFVDKLVKLKDTVGNVFKTIGETISEFWNSLMNTDLGKRISKLFDTIRTTVSKAWTSFTKWISNLFKKKENTGDSVGVLDWLIDKFTKFIDWMKNLDIDKITKSISDFLTNIIDKAKTAYNAVRDTFSNIGGKVSEFWTAFLDTDLGKKIKNAFETVKETVKNAWESVKNWFKDLFKGDDSDTEETVSVAGGVFDWLMQRITEFNEWVSNLNMTQIAEDISNFFTNFVDHIKNGFNAVREWIENNEILNSVITFVTEKIQALKDAFNIGANQGEEGGEQKPFIQRVLDGLKSALEWFRDNGPDIINTIIEMLKGGVLFSIISLIRQIKKVFTGDSSILTAFQKFLGGVNSALRAYAFDKYANGIMKLAIAFAAIIGVMGLVAYYVPADKLLATAAAVAVLAAGLGVLAIGIAAVINALAGKKATDTAAKGSKPTAIDKLLGDVGTTLKSFGTAMDKLADGAAKYMKYKGIAYMLVGLAAALAVLVAGVWALSQINLQDLIKGIAAVGVLIGLLTVAMKILMSGNSTSFGLDIGKHGLTMNGSAIGQLSSAFGFIGMAVAVLIFVQLIDQLRQYSYSDIFKAVVTIGAILLELAAAVRIGGGSFRLTTGLGAMAMAESVIMLMQAMDVLRTFDYAGILKGVVSIGAILLELSIATRIAGGSMSLTKGAGMFLLAEAVNALVPAMERLAHMSWTEILKGAAAITALCTALGIGGLIFTAAKGGVEALTSALQAFGTALMAIAITAGVVAYALAHDLDLEEIGQGISVLAVNMVQGFVDAITGSADAIIGGIVTLLETLVEYAPQIVDLLVSLFIKVLDGLTIRMPELADAIANFCKALIDNFGIAFQNVDLSGLKSAIEELLIATGALVLIGRFGSFGTILSGIAQFAAVVVALGGLMAAFGGLYELFGSGMVDVLNEGGDVLEAIGNSIGKFLGGLFGSFVGSTLEAFTDSLPDIADNLCSFLEKIQPFIEGCSAIDENFTQSIGYLTSGMLAITGGSFFDALADGLAKLINGDSEYDAMKEYLEDFNSVADALVVFNDKIKDVDWADMDKATSAAGVLTALIDAVPETGGYLQDFLGYKKLADAGIDFTSLGEGVKNFCAEVGSASSFDADTVGNAAKCISSLIENYPETGGTLQKFLGYKDLSTAEVNFGSLGAGIKAFCDAIGTDASFDVDSVTAAATCINALLENYPETGGTLQDFLGYKKLSEAQVNFRLLGRGVRDFVKAIGTDASFDVDSVTAAATCINALLENYPETGGTLQDLIGYKKLSEAEINFSSLGKGVREFVDAIGTDASFDAESAKGAAEVIAALIENYPTSGGALQDLIGYKKLAEADVDFKALGEGVRAFSDAIGTDATFDVDAATNATTIIQKLIDITPNTGGLWQQIAGEKDLGKLGTNMGILGEGIGGFISNVSGITAEQVSLGSVVASGMIDIFNLPWPVSGGFITWFSDAFDGTLSFDDIKTNMGKIGETAQTMVNSLGGITEGDLANCQTAADGIIAIFEMHWPETSGLFGFIKNFFEGGDTDWGAITTMGETIGSFCDSIADITTDKLETAKTVSGAIIDLMSLEGWPKDNGLIGDIAVALTGKDQNGNGVINWQELKEDIVDMATAIGEFCRQTNGVTAEYIGTSKEVASAIIDLLGLSWPEDNGLFGKMAQWAFGGDVVWSDLKDDISDMSEAIGTFCFFTNGVTADYIEASKKVAEAIIDLLGLDWPKDNGFFGDIHAALYGDDSIDWEEVKTSVPIMSSAIRTFCDETTGIDDSYIGPAIAAANCIIELLGLNWPTSQGAVVEFFNGLFGADAGVKWTDMETNLPAMGRSVKGFVDATSGISTIASINAAICANAIGILLETLPDDSTTRIDNLLDFINYLPMLSESVIEFTTNMSSINVVSFMASINGIAALIDVMNTMADVDLASATGFTDALATLAETGISDFIAAFTDSKETAVQTAVDFINAVISAIAISDEFKTAGSDDGSAFSDGFDVWPDTIVMNAKILITNMLEALTKESDFKSAGNDDGSAFNDGFDQWPDKIVSNVETMITDMLNALSQGSSFQSAGNDNASAYNDGFDMYSDTIVMNAEMIISEALDNVNQYASFYDAGLGNGTGIADGIWAAADEVTNAVSYIASDAVYYANKEWEYYDVGGWAMSGLANGMWDNAWQVYNAADEIGDRAADRIRSRMQVQSPSKVFYEIGMYCMKGLGNGFIENAENMVYKPIEDVADDSIDLMKGIAGSLDFTDLDNAPTIRPVLDLTNIQNGAAKIDELLGADTLMGLDAINAQIMANRIHKAEIAASINNTYDDSDVINTINALGDRVDALGESINNMKLYLNGKELVGGIAVDMNNALGGIDRKMKRGVM